MRGGGGAVVNYGGDTAASENAKCYTDQTPLSFQHVLVIPFFEYFLLLIVLEARSRVK